MMRCIGQTSLTSPLAKSIARSQCLSTSLVPRAHILRRNVSLGARGMSTTSSINEEYNLPSTINASVLHTYSPLPSESVSDNVPIPFPAVRPHEVVVKIYATSINPIDYEMMTGYGSKAMDLFRPLPAALGRECTGVVVAAGPAVFDFRVGDAVWCAPSAIKAPGCHADYIVVTEKELALKPASLSFTEAAALPYSALTAWRALVDVGGVPVIPGVTRSPTLLGVGAALLDKALNAAAQAPGAISAATDAAAGVSSSVRDGACSTDSCAAAKEKCATMKDKCVAEQAKCAAKQSKCFSQKDACAGLKEQCNILKDNCSTQNNNCCATNSCTGKNNCTVSSKCSTACGHKHKEDESNSFVRPGSLLAALSPLNCLRTVLSRFGDSGAAVRRGSFVRPAAHTTAVTPAAPLRAASPDAASTAPADAATPSASATASAQSVEQPDANAPRVFIHGGSGPLGRFAVQLLRSHGVRVAVSCSAANAPSMRALGAENVVDYRTFDFNNSVWADGGKADVVLDCAGGAAQAVLLAGQAKRGGKVVSVYQLLNNMSHSHSVLPVAAAETFGDYASLKQELATRFGVEFYFTIFEPNAAALKYISKLVDQGIVTPAVETVVDTPLQGYETFHKRKTGEAYEHKVEDVRPEYTVPGGKVVVRMVKE